MNVAELSSLVSAYTRAGSDLAGARRALSDAQERLREAEDEVRERHDSVVFFVGEVEELGDRLVSTGVEL